MKKDQITILGCPVFLSKSGRGRWIVNYRVLDTPMVGHVLSLLLDGRQASVSSITGTGTKDGPIIALVTDFTNKKELLRTLRRPISVADIS